jgi:hypothetical protein
MATSIFQSVADLLKKGLSATDPALPTLLEERLATLTQTLDQLTALEVSSSGNGIEQWLLKFASLADALEPRVQSTLMVRALQVYAPPVAEVLTLADVIGIEWQPNADPPHPRAFAVNWDQITDWLSKPGSTAIDLLTSTITQPDDLKSLQALTLMLFTAPRALVNELEYTGQGFAALPLPPGEPIGVDLDDLTDLINSPITIGLPLPTPQDGSRTLAEIVAAATPPVTGAEGTLTVDGDPAGAGSEVVEIGLHLQNPSDFATETIDLGNGWSADFEANDTVPQDYKVRFGPTGVDPAVRPSGNLVLTIRKSMGNAIPLFSGDEKSNFSIAALGAGLTLRAQGAPFSVSVSAQDIVLTLQPEFLKFASFGLPIPDTLEMRSTVKLTFTPGEGIAWEGDNAVFPELSLRQVLPLDLKLGSDAAGASLDQVMVRFWIGLDASGVRLLLEQRYGARGSMGPLSAVLDGAGVAFGNWPGEAEGLLAPDGIGISLKAGPVDGGGFLKYFKENQEFGGALQVKILGIGAFAYGLYRTLPSGAPSFVAMIGIRLPIPGVQIGFGFAISGFGGLVGINRRADTDLLRERLASGAAGDVLFNDNPMANAPKLLGDMQQFFPSEDGIFLIGPTFQINWLELLKLDVGVFIELPGPRKIFIAGSARLVLGSEEFALVYLRMDFTGGIDLTRSLIFFDAALVNSHVLGIVRITGGVALRIAYGSNGYFLFSVGGFHPQFKPGAMDVPRVARVGVSFSAGVVWLKQDMYLALTSNTFQFGARVEAGLDLGPIAAHGWFGFDALVQFKPFYFIATIDAGFDVEALGVSLCSVRVSGQLTGPGPLQLQARASVKILLARVSGSISITLSSEPGQIINPIPNIPKHLKPELDDPGNLRFEGEDRGVILRDLDPKAKLCSPVGALIWEQKRAPLGLPISKLEGTSLGGFHTLTVKKSGAGTVTPEQDWFGEGTFRELSDAEALNMPKFVQHPSGIRVEGGKTTSQSTGAAKMKIDLYKLPKRIRIAVLIPISLYVNAGLVGVLDDRANGAAMPKPGAQVKVHQETWNAHASDGTVIASGVTSTAAAIGAMQVGGVAAPAANKPLVLAGVV